MKSLHEQLKNLKGEERVKKVRELEEIFGTKDLCFFGTYDREIFEESLKGMNLSDMRKLAAKVGVSPYQEKSILKDSLRRSFEMETKDKRGFITAPPQPAITLDPKNPKHKETINLMGDL